MRVEDGRRVNLGFRGGEPKNAVVILVSRDKNSFEGLFTKMQLHVIGCRLYEK